MRIAEEPITGLGLHGEIPIAFLVEHVLDVALVEEGLGGVVMSERAVEVPWVKDYDAIEGGTDEMSGTLRRHQLGTHLRPRLRPARGGAVVAFDTAGVSMLEGRGDLAVLWDIRVHPASRSSGMGHCSFALSKRGLAIGTAAR